MKLPLKIFVIIPPPQKKNSLKFISSIKKCHENHLVAGNDLFPHCASFHTVADMDVLIKQITTV